MWRNVENDHKCMFPPMPFSQNHNDTEMSSNRRFQHRGRGRGRSRGHYQHNNANQRENTTGRGNHQFYCDTCDRAFESDSLLSEHVSQHKTCSWDGCTFEAHYKIVELHIKMQHETGFAEKIMHLNTPEDIEKWKKERKRNFPTADNIAKRQAEQARQAERGELIPSKEFGKFNKNDKKPFERNNFMRGRGRGRGRQGTYNGSDRTMDQSVDAGRGGQSRRKRRRQNNNDNEIGTRTDLPEESNDFFGFRKFAGTSSTTADSGRDVEVNEDNPVNDLISDSDDEMAAPTHEAIVRIPEAAIPKALENLLAAYSSESEEEINAQKNVPVPMPNTKPSNPQRENFPKATNRPCVKSHKRFTLLEMLLAKEIQIERNKVFQCIRYIVENEFFGIQ